MRELLDGAFRGALSRRWQRLLIGLLVVVLSATIVALFTHHVPLVLAGIAILVLSLLAAFWPLKRKRKDYVQGMFLIALLWYVSFVLSDLATALLQSLANHVNYSGQAFGLLLGSLLAFIGVVFAILIAVFNSITGQKTTLRYNGAQNLTKATAQLECFNIRLEKMRLSLELGAEAPGAAPYGEDKTKRRKLLDALTQDIDKLTSRLNGITMNWRGWETDTNLEQELVAHSKAAKAVLEPIEDKTHEMLTEYRQIMRGVLIGLRALDEATLSDTLAIRLSIIMGSLVVLIGAGLFLRLVADLDVGAAVSDAGTFRWAALFCMSTVLHMLALVFAVSHWFDKVRQRDETWAS